jgi:hypothetical protein
MAAETHDIEGRRVQQQHIKSKINWDNEATERPGFDSEESSYLCTEKTP